MGSLPFDLKLAARSLARRPGATALVVVSLALTIGVASAAFNVIDAVLWRDLPVREPSRLVSVWARDRQQRVAQLSWIEFEAIAHRVRGLSDLVAQSRHVSGVKFPDRTEYPLVAAVSDNFFDALGVNAVVGRVFHTGAGGTSEVVISYRYWQRALLGDPGIVGRTLQIDSADIRVLGVLPPGFSGANRGLAVDLFYPVETAFGVLRFGSLTDKTNTDFEVLGRVVGSADQDRIQRDMDAVLRQVDRDGASPGPARTGMLAKLDWSEQPGVAAIPALFIAIVLLVLLVATANVANMRLAQNEERRGETAIRVALGASRLALWRQHLGEMLLLTGLGTAAAVLVASWLIDLAPSMLFPGQRFIDFNIHLDLRTFTFAVGAMVLVALVGTILPFKDAAAAVLTSNLVTRTATTRSRWLPALVMVQIAFVTGVICVAGLLLQSFRNVSAIRPAMDPDRPLLLVAGFWQTEGDPEVRASALAVRMSALPGVRSVAYARRALLSGSGGGAAVPVEMPRQPTFNFRYDQVSPNYFATTGAQVRRGRAFTEADGARATKVTIVSEAFVRRFFPNGQDPLGTWIRAAGSDRQIIGVVEDGPSIHLKEAPEPFLYFPFAQLPTGELTLFVQTASDPASSAATVRRYLSASEAGFVALSLQTMAEHMHAARSEEALAAAVAGGMAGLGLLLAAAGLFGVTLFAVGRRTREFGVRVALGATSSTLGRQVLRESARRVAIGLAFGCALAYAGHRLIQRQLYGVSGADATSVVAAILIVAAVSLVATLQPALRAARVDPIVALRNE